MSKPKVKAQTQSKAKSQSSPKSRSQSKPMRKLIVRPADGQPIALLFLSRSELQLVREMFDETLRINEKDHPWTKGLSRIYKGIKPESEIEVER